MQIIRNSLDTSAGPSDWFSGDVYIDTVTAPSNDWRISAAAVHFSPGARTAWHTHPNGHPDAQRSALHSFGAQFAEVTRTPTPARSAYRGCSECSTSD